jgi:two-component system KDP operon response regulator KdpE
MTEEACILIVDDEQAIRYFLSEELSHAGYRVLTASSGEAALVRLQQESIDLVLLDLKMGGMSGLQVMREIEEQPLPPEVIILTAHASFDSVVDAMRLGGSDYLRKPCETEALLSSVEKGLAKRRKALQQQHMLHLIEETARQLQPSPLPAAEPATQPPRFLEERGLLWDREAETVALRGETLALTPTEFRLLICLMENPDRLVSYRELVAALHGSESEEWDEREVRAAISTHMWRLRRKIGQDRDGSPYIVNVRGRGYKFVGSEKGPSMDQSGNLL